MLTVKTIKGAATLAAELQAVADYLARVELGRRMTARAAENDAAWAARGGTWN